MLQRLPLALAQVKAGNTSEKLLKEIRQITYYLHRENEITKNLYNWIQWIQWRYNKKVDAVFMNSKNSKTSDPHRLIFNLINKINLKGSDKYVAMSMLSIYYT